MSLLSTAMAYYPYVFHPAVLVGGGLLLLIRHEWRRQDDPNGTLARRVGAFLVAGAASLLPTAAYVVISGKGPMQVTQGNTWQVDALVASGVLVVCVSLWYCWTRFDWGTLVPGGVLALAAVTIPYAAVSSVWNVSGHVIFAVTPTLYLTLTDARFWPLLAVPAVMVPNRVYVEAHTPLQAVCGALLAASVVTAVYALRVKRPLAGASGASE
ncbi:hypothetical protein C474_05325 [Halogeometricum pallidum JCM 14848]|uniref:Phosphatidic acid phosphatase type 2/haloperoxidase domain-containing protein n=1 Tax=Halogeometricum pallidum JCM 14848 TaxID=1227487 RepID=M0DDD6_HALPD|nr:phosphatase PAP2 family protein [Halogeometricum pallidum]ELZ33475.1 hypothetical protein C474_05325 [Halogeometricum pallidum JCM 14848]